MTGFITTPLFVDKVGLTEGQMMSPYGPSLLQKGSLFSCSRQNMMMGKVKTKVFPEPVKAIPIMSRPERLQTRALNTSDTSNICSISINVT